MLLLPIIPWSNCTNIVYVVFGVFNYCVLIDSSTFEEQTSSTEKPEEAMETGNSETVISTPRLTNLDDDVGDTLGEPI